MEWANKKANPYSFMWMNTSQQWRSRTFAAHSTSESKGKKAKLKQLESDGIIERAEGPKSWSYPIVVVSKPLKPNQIRISVDKRSLKKAIIRERHVIPTIDEVLADLNGCEARLI